MRFCGNCGSALESAPAGEERKLGSVLFADAVASTALAAGSDPERAARAPGSPTCTSLVVTRLRLGRRRERGERSTKQPAPPPPSACAPASFSLPGSSRVVTLAGF